MKKIISIVGARPQFIKHAPIQMELMKYYDAVTIHTGQHYDSNMSDVFFKELNIPKPNYLLDIANKKLQGAQTGIMIEKIEEICLNEKPDALLIYGDTNSTLAGALVAAKLNIKQIHVEAGLRSFNRSMPEEVNRIVADEFAFLLFCSGDNAIANLKKEGINHERIFECGDVMIDMLEIVKSKLRRLYDDDYYFATIHRPYNTDDIERLKNILLYLNKVDKKVVFSIHPRTVARMNAYGLYQTNYDNIYFIEPVSYIDSISYQFFSSCIITDSGGIQKESYHLKKKCITIRSETEWTETLSNGWNTLMFDNLEKLGSILDMKTGLYKENIYGDGFSAHKIVKTIRKFF